MRRSRPAEHALILMSIATATCVGPPARAEEPLSAMIPVDARPEGGSTVEHRSILGAILIESGYNQLLPRGTGKEH